MTLKLNYSMMTLAMFSLLYSHNTFAIAPSSGIGNIERIQLSPAFSEALKDGMTLPLYIHLNTSKNRKDDQHIGSVVLYLDNKIIHISKLILINNQDNTTINPQLINILKGIKNKAFNDKFTIPLTEHANLKFNLKQLVLQLVVDKKALNAEVRTHIEKLGHSSVSQLSSIINYNIGVYNNRMQGHSQSLSSTSSFLKIYDISSIKEHHFSIDSSFYNLGSSDQDSQIYKAMYEHDFAGHRFAAGMISTWDLQSLAPMTAISSGKIYGLSWGNKSQTEKINSNQSLIPIIAFLPSTGEVHLSRNGHLLSVQNFTMGNHEVDTQSLPWGVYDVDVEVVVNGRLISKHTQRINKIFNSQQIKKLTWQIWGGSFLMDDKYYNNNKYYPSQKTALIGASVAKSFRSLSLAASAYNYNSINVAETRFSTPWLGFLNIEMQNMIASDKSWSDISSLSASLPGGFSSIFLSHERMQIGNKINLDNTNNLSLGGNINLGVWLSYLGNLSVNYTIDHKNNYGYINADYSQNVYSGRYGTLSFRAGLQQYNSRGDQPASQQKYLSLSFSLPLGSWFNAGVSQQGNSATLNLTARKSVDYGIIKSIGASVSRSLNDSDNSNSKYGISSYALYQSHLANGVFNLSNNQDGSVNSNLTANGSIGWQGTQLATTGQSDKDAGIILATGLDDKGQISARVNGQFYTLEGGRAFLPLSAYQRYNIELMNSKNTIDNLNIVSDRKFVTTLFPGNVAVIQPQIKQMVTVFGRIKAEDGTPMVDAKLHTKLGRAHTNKQGDFVMDVDKHYPFIAFSYDKQKECEAELNLSAARGAVWVGDVTCKGLKTYAVNQETEQHVIS